MQALSCLVCGAPLPDAKGIVRCRHCGTRADTGEADPAPAPEEVARRGLQAVLRLHEAQKKGAAIEVGLAEAARELVGGGTDTTEVARITAGIGRAFEEEHGVQGALVSPAVAQRLLAATLAAIDQVRREGTSELHLPFFFATAKGPLDLRMRLDRDRLARLRDAPSPPPKKKGWWPF